MKRFVLSLLTLIQAYYAFSQRQYFIYIQAEPEQAFFIKMNEKVHSSTASGYLILSQLNDSSYNFTIGFPENKWPEQKFNVGVKGKDHGYLLKNFSEKGWGLVDLQSMATVMNLSGNNGIQKTEQKDVSVFTDILSKAANDPSLKEKPVATTVALKEEKKTEPVEANVKNEMPVVTTPVIKKEDQPVVNKQEPVKKEEPAIVKKDEPAESMQPPVVKTDEAKPDSVKDYKRSVVTKKSESSTSEGMGLSFVDDYGNGKKDTINIFIPNPKSKVAISRGPAKEEKKFLDINGTDTVKKEETAQKREIVQKNENAQKTAPVADSATKEVVPPVAKNKCAGTAGESDFLKIRKNMAAETTDDDMVDQARKYFKTKCFSTKQIKNLSTLFLEDEGKYKFFDVAYKYVLDPDNFPSLESELKDQYYITRFKAMLH